MASPARRLRDGLARELRRRSALQHRAWYLSGYRQAVADARRDGPHADDADLTAIADERLGAWVEEGR